MATMATTPVRNRGSELSNESPLPTPPQAMHDLISRKGSGIKRSSSGPRSSLDGRADGDQGPSSPSDRAASHLMLDAYSVRRQREAKGAETIHEESSRHGPSEFSLGQGSNTKVSGTQLSSTGASMRQGQRSALGAQLGIRNDASPSQDPPLAKPASTQRPSLREYGKRTASYESSGSASGSTGKQDTRQIASRRSSQHSLANEESGRLLPDSQLPEKENADAQARATYGKVPRQYSTGDARSNVDAMGHAAPAGGPVQSSKYTHSRATDLQRRTSGENEAHADMHIVRQRPHEEDTPAARRGVLREQYSPRQETANEEDSLAQHKAMASLDAGGASASSYANYQTPSLSTASRGLRSGQASRHAAAPWSVGRSIKRIDRHSAPDKPPQRIIAQETENDDEEDEAEQVGNGMRPLPAVQEDDGGNDEPVLHQPVREPVSQHSASKAGLRRHASRGEIDGVRTSLHVPLGADDDEEEDDGGASLQAYRNRPVRRDQFEMAESGAMQQQRRKAAMNDIISARVPPAAAADIRRGLPNQNNGNIIAEQVQQAAKWPSDSVTASTESVVSSPTDFMSLVRREATQQRGQPFIEQILSKPSKDLETKFNGYKFKKIRKAGEGGFSTVWVVRGPSAIPDALQPSGYRDISENDQAYFAMKQVTLKKMEKVSRDEVLEECNVLQSLASKPNNEDYILRFFGWKSSTGSLKILIELGEHDFNHILRSQRLSRTQIVTYWYQMLQAVHFTHEEGNIVHTDLKPANFLMANGRLKLIDFGIAQKIPVGTIHIKRDAMIGTPNYMAPETVRAVKEARNFGVQGSMNGASQLQLDVQESGQSDAKTVRVYKAGKASDVWALGCILYQMVYCRPPFEGFHGDDKLREILDPKHRITFDETRYGPSRPGQHTADRNAAAQGDADDEGILESVDADLLDAMRLTLTYSAAERVTIPQLFDHPLLRPLEQQRRADLRRRMHGDDGSIDDVASSTVDGRHDAETVHMTRAELKDILRKMYTYARNGELRDDNLDARSDALFDNVRKRQQQHTSSS